MKEGKNLKMSNKIYDTLKVVRLILMTAATIYVTFGQIWTGIIPLPYPDQVSATLIVIATALDGTLFDSSKKYAARVNGDYNQGEE